MKIQFELLGINITVSLLRKFLRFEEGHIKILRLDLFEAIRGTELVPWRISSKAELVNVEVYHLEISPLD